MELTGDSGVLGSGVMGHGPWVAIGVVGGGESGGLIKVELFDGNATVNCGLICEKVRGKLAIVCVKDTI